MGLSEHPRKKFENVPISSFLILTLCFADGLPQLQNHVKFNHKQQVSRASHFHLSTCLSFLEKGGHQCSQMTQNLHPSWEIVVMMNPMHLVLDALACHPMVEHPCIHSNIPSDSKISPTRYRETVKKCLDQKKHTRDPRDCILSRPLQHWINTIHASKLTRLLDTVQTLEEIAKQQSQGNSQKLFKLVFSIYPANTHKGSQWRPKRLPFWHWINMAYASKPA